ncbi:outer membrane protein [Polaribacter porphyrae]|uniref:Outer membrane protein beta-barrel domain-containing protein n=1 Tax=Polaribacter porphyrae TaxID=1137780 RepID=A0A2S7WL65_9FLAO|nr:outer membrane beta-barrel protein [Polaribacter porphyrae]PQJ78042.1 hypothetical protein BTO18_02030 [Polaribacter porphyrae]
MKLKKIALFLVTLFAINTYSQTEKGKIYLGASSNLNANFINNSIKDDNNGSQNTGKNSGFSISPEIGFLVIDNLVLGANITLAFNKSENNGGSEFKSSSISAAPFIKYYFSENKFKPFVSGRFAFGSFKSESTFNNNSNESKGSFTNLQVGGGIAYFINDMISLELGINYVRSSNKQSDNNPNNLKSISSGVSSSVGFAIFL